MPAIVKSLFAASRGSGDTHMETEAVATVAVTDASPAVGALVLIAFAAVAWQFWRHRRIEVTTLLWQLPFAGLLGFIIYWCGQGFVED
ncbi:hypothetical protein ACTQ11_00830 [Collinsella bouchesdurhonensis]|uniref:hypothetical protein n=1 Tax=Collinsella bouchesdurhonensis TaxID=1907654 RepID=UPI003F929EE1